MMAPSTLLSPLLWAEATFGAVQLGDPRRVRRAVAIAQALATETGASLPRQLHDGAALEATYRFVHSGMSATKNCCDRMWRRRDRTVVSKKRCC